jgi:biopolymer transport protein TolQ
MNETAAGKVIMGNVDAVAKGTSFLNLFLEADFFVQLIMLMLLGASIWCWAIIFNKYQEFRKMQKEMEKFEKLFWSGKSLDKILDEVDSKANHPMGRLFMAAMKEWNESGHKGTMDQRIALTHRISRILQVSLDHEMKNLQKHTGFLATTGSAAPFVGLLGTVWGIMNSFQSIASSKNTSLAVVAPGIAEALLATALGLVAAIPAVVAYNRISQNINDFGARLELFVSELETMLSRRLLEG